MTGDDFYRSIPLTEEEIEAALLEGKKKKFFRERAKENGTWDTSHTATAESPSKTKTPDSVQAAENSKGKLGK